MSVVRLPKETIDRIFERVDNQMVPHQFDACLLLYKEVLPDWDRIEKVDGYPQVTKKTNEYIFRKFMDFDDKHHKNVLRGGLWMNNGFGTCSAPDDLNDWEVFIDPAILKYKKEATQ